MRYAIIMSTQDPAGMNIKTNLLVTGEFTELADVFDGHQVFEHRSRNARLYTTDRQCIHAEHIDRDINAQYFIFATRHRAKSGIPSLTVHAPGNWADAQLGGSPRKVSVPMPNHMKEALKFMIRDAHDQEEKSFEIVQEATHHGPDIDKPCMFIEVGSDEKGWEDPAAGKIVAKAIIHIITAQIEQGKTAFVIGGGHYSKIAQKLMRDSEYAVGHVCPKHSLVHLDHAMLVHAMEKSGPAATVVLDWKGLGQEKNRIIQLLDEHKIHYIRSDRLEEKSYHN